MCGRWTPHLFERRPVYQIESSSHVIKINQSQELSLRLGNPPDRNSLKFPWQALQLWGKYVWNFLHRESCVSKFVIWRTKVKIWNTNISLWNYEWNLAFGKTHPLKQNRIILLSIRVVINRNTPLRLLLNDRKTVSYRFFLPSSFVYNLYDLMKSTITCYS